MKQVILILFGFGFLVWPRIGISQEEDISEKAQRREIVSPMGDTFLRNRVNELERRMSHLEEDLNFLEERTENLDRAVDDLRRHH